MVWLYAKRIFKLVIMPRPTDEPLRKTTLNLYKSDTDFLAEYYGQGWSEQVRQIVHQHCEVTKGHRKVRKTLGDLER